MEISFHELLHALGVALQVVAECFIVELAQFCYNAVYHALAEHAVLLVNLTLTLQAFCRSHAVVWQTVELCQSFFVGLIVDVHVHVCAFCHLESIGHFKAMAACHA